MSGVKPSPDRYAVHIALVEQCLREGFEPSGGQRLRGPGTRTAVAEAANRLNPPISYEGFLGNLKRAKSTYGMEPDWSLYRPQRYQQPVPKAVIMPAILPSRHHAEIDGGEDILVIGDLHQDPRMPHRLPVLTWAARLASERNIKRIIQIGDWSTFDSVNFHDDNRSLAARTKPSIRSDLDNLTASHQAFRRGLSEGYRPKLDFLQGNHENRLERFENMNPESAGMFTHERDQTFLQFGWRSRPYGEYMYVEGVGFTHHPTNGAGRAFGGETGPQRAGAKSTVPVVSGHTHRRQLHSTAKIGPVECITMVEVGCGMLWGEIEHYAKHSLNGWWYGVVPMRVCAGQIIDVEFISMLSLMSRYSDHGADVRAA